MDLNSIMGGGIPEKEPSFEYSAQANSPTINGEVKITIGENSLTVSSLFDIAEIPFCEINLLSLADYVVKIETENGIFAFSYLGNFCEPFFNELLTGYNNAVLRSLFVAGSPILTAKGDYRYTENGTTISGSAPVNVYENCVTVLPLDLSARRVPLCFVSGINKGDYELTLTVDGDNYTFSKLGYDTAPFETAIEKQIRALREKAFSTVKGICPTLTSTQISQIVKLMPAVPVGKIAEIAPDFLKVLEEKLTQSCIAEYYSALKEISDPTQIHIGFREKTPAEIDTETALLQEIAQKKAEENAQNAQENPENPSANLGETPEEITPDPYLLWVIAPSSDGKTAVLEFAEENSATYLYRTEGDFPAFVKQLSRALEAIDFKRDVIRLTDEELKKPEYVDYYMASKRTPALQFVRSRFAGRAIHSNLSAWRKKISP